MFLIKIQLFTIIMELGIIMGAVIMGAVVHG